MARPGCRALADGRVVAAASQADGRSRAAACACCGDCAELWKYDLCPRRPEASDCPAPPVPVSVYICRDTTCPDTPGRTLTAVIVYGGFCYRKDVIVPRSDLPPGAAVLTDQFTCTEYTCEECYPCGGPPPTECGDGCLRVDTFVGQCPQPPGEPVRRCCCCPRSYVQFYSVDHTVEFYGFNPGESVLGNRFVGTLRGSARRVCQDGAGCGPWTAAGATGATPGFLRWTRVYSGDNPSDPFDIPDAFPVDEPPACGALLQAATTRQANPDYNGLCCYHPGEAPPGLTVTGRSNVNGCNRAELLCSGVFDLQVGLGPGAVRRWTWTFRETYAVIPLDGCLGLCDPIAPVPRGPAAAVRRLASLLRPPPAASTMPFL